MRCTYYAIPAHKSVVTYIQGKSPNMIVVRNVGYRCVFRVCLRQVEYVTIEQKPSNDIRKKDWIAGGSLFQIRALICSPARQCFGQSFCVRFSIAQV